MVSETAQHEVISPPSLLSLEYISLIVIILSFVVAIFSRQMQGSPSGVIATPSPKVINTRPMKILSMKRFFAPGSASVQRRVVKPWAALVAQHDITVHATIAGNDSSRSDSSERSWSLAIARAVSLRRYFEGEGIPPNALRIQAVARRHPLSDRMTIRKEAR